MPFNREWAKANGYSDAEIDAYLSSEQAQADSVDAQQATPSGGGMNPAAAAGLGIAGAAGTAALVPVAKKAIPAAGRAVSGAIERVASAPMLRHAPGAPNVRNMAKDAATIFGAKPPAKSSAAPAAAKIPASLVELSEADIKRFPELKGFKPGETIRRSQLEKIKLAAGKTVHPTRPITIHEGGKRIPAKAPAPTPASPGAGRGKSRPALARGAEAMASAKARREGIPLEEARSKIAGLIERSKVGKVVGKAAKGLAAVDRALGVAGITLSDEAWAKIMSDLEKQSRALGPRGVAGPSSI